jgi:hypothetical protein
MIFCHDLHADENAERKDGKKQKPGAASNGSGVGDAHKRVRSFLTLAERVACFGKFFMVPEGVCEATSLRLFQIAHVETSAAVLVVSQIEGAPRIDGG